MASITNAASSENNEMRDEIPYIGTMSIIRITILYRFGKGQPIVLDGILARCKPLQTRLAVILELEIDRHCRYQNSDQGGNAGEYENNSGEP